VALIKRHKNISVLAEEAFEYEYNTDYCFKVIVRNDIISLFINDVEIFACEDDYYQYGQIGMGVYKSSHCHFKDVIVRDLSE
jgi:hypothetical protein